MGLWKGEEIKIETLKQDQRGVNARSLEVRRCKKSLGGRRLTCPAGMERISWEDIKDEDEDG